MKCPLFVLAKTAHYSENVMITTDCLKEECAWWNKDRGVCSVKLGAGAIYDLWYQLTQIKEKMPHEEQFRK